MAIRLAANILPFYSIKNDHSALPYFPKRIHQKICNLGQVSTKDGCSRRAFGSSCKKWKW